MSGAAMQPVARRRTRKQFDEGDFRALHESTGKLDFTPDFNPSIEDLLRDPEIPVRAKTLALLKLQAWGNQSRFAVHDHARDTDFLEADVARYFGVSRQVVNRHVRDLDDRCLLRRIDGRLYPVADPGAERERRKGELSTPGGDKQPSSSPRLRLALENLFKEEPHEFERFTSALKTLDEIKRKAIKRYRPADVSTPGEQMPENGDHRSGHDADTGADTNATPERTQTDPILITKEEIRIRPSSSSVSPVAAALNEYAKADDDATNKLISACKAEDPECTGEQIAAAVHEKAQLLRRGNIANPIGFFLTAVPKIIKQVARPASHPVARAAPDPEAEREREAEWRRDLEQRLQDDTVSEEEKKTIRSWFEVVDA
jgi:hypothetical protein